MQREVHVRGIFILKHYFSCVNGLKFIFTLCFRCKFFSSASKSQEYLISAHINPVQSKEGGGGGWRPKSHPQTDFSIIILEQFGIQSSNYTTFRKIFLSVFQHYPWSHVCMVTDNLEGTYSIFEFLIL